MKVIRLKKGQKVIESLEAKLENVKGGIVFGIGALAWAKLKIYDLKTKEYKEKLFKGPLEVANFTAVISKDESNKTKLHPHIVVCDSDFSSFGGHLEEAETGATFEAIILESDFEIRRYFDSEIGLKLIKD